MSKTWEVTLPIAGYLVVRVEAENEDAAIEAAMLSDFNSDDIELWEAHKEIVRGNVCHAAVNKAFAEEAD